MARASQCDACKTYYTHSDRRLGEGRPCIVEVQAYTGESQPVLGGQLVPIYQPLDYCDACQMILERLVLATHKGGDIQPALRSFAAAAGVRWDDTAEDS